MPSRESGWTHAVRVAAFVIVITAYAALSGCAFGVDDGGISIVGPDAASAQAVDGSLADELTHDPYPCLAYEEVAEPRHYLGHYDRPYFFWPDKPDVKLSVKEGRCVATVYSSGDPNLVYFQGPLSRTSMSPIQVSYYVTPGTGVAGIELRFVHTATGVFPYGGEAWQDGLTILHQQVP